MHFAEKHIGVAVDHIGRFVFDWRKQPRHAIGRKRLNAADLAAAPHNRFAPEVDCLLAKTFPLKAVDLIGVADRGERAGERCFPAP